MTTTAPTAALEALVQQLADIQEQRTHLTEREDNVKAAIRAVTPPGSYKVAGLALSVTQARKLDATAAAARYTAAEHPELWVPTLDAKRLKAHLPPADYDELMVPNGEPRVSLR